MDHERCMNLAYQEALKAFDEGEVPVGAVVVKDGRMLGRGYNRIEKLGDATAHAEIIALGAAANSLAAWRLDGCTLYVTLEPCLMCLGAAMQSRVECIVYACADPRLGAIETFFYRQEIERAYKRFPKIVTGVCADQCSELIRSFFADARRNNSE
jgi:tRNA(adenine34) deaminase